MRLVLLFTCFETMAQCSDTLPAKWPLGTNLNGLADWNLDRPFNDEFICNRGFSANLNAPWNYVAVSTDTSGWPLQDFSVIVMSNMQNNKPATYLIQFNGKATINPIASSFKVQNQQYDSIRNSTSALLVYQNNPDQMMISFTNTKYTKGIAGIKNIHIYKPGLDANAPIFSQQFLTQLQRFQAIRFMTWSNTNGSTDSLWNNRTQLSYAAPLDPAHINHGIPWEYCIELCNTLKKDIWINIPHMATDDYVFQLATLLKNNLDPSLHIYVEYSNELWNSSFPQSGWNLAQAIQEGKANGPVNYDGINDQWTWHYRRIAQRGKEISDIFKTVFTGVQTGERLRPVYATQIGYFDVGQRGLEFVNNYYGAPGQFFYALAGAPYFKAVTTDTSNTATPIQVLNALHSAILDQFYGYSNNIAQYAASCNYYGLKFICYEGGPDTFGPNNINSKASASRDTAMKTLCINYLDQWYRYGATGLFMWFTAGASSWETQYGTWSLTENYEYSQKLAAMDSILSQPVTAAAAGQSIAIPIDARQYAGYTSNWNQSATFTPFWEPYVQYLLNVPSGSAGEYEFFVNTQCSSPNSSFKVLVDNQLLDSLVVPVNKDTGFVTNKLGTIFLKEGLHTLRYTASPNGNNYSISKYTAVLKTACNATVLPVIPGDEIFQCYPNPATDLLHISCKVVQVPTTVNIYNEAGAKVYSGVQNQSGFDIPLSGFHKGVYFIRIGTQTRAFLKM